MTHSCTLRSHIPPRVVFSFALRSDSVTYALGELKIGSGQAEAEMEKKIPAVLVVSSEGCVW